MTKNKIYNGYAFTENESDKYDSNKRALQELREKYTIYETCSCDYESPTEEELDNNDIVFTRIPKYHNADYIFFKCPDDLTDDELCLICDGDIFNLCYGGKATRYTSLPKVNIRED